MCESVCFQSTVAFVLFVFCFLLIRMRLPAAAEVFFAWWSFFARMYTRLFAGAGLRVFVFASSRMPDSPLANRHGCSRRPSLKLISHSGGFFVWGQPLLIRILPLGLLWYWNPPMVRESSIGEYQQCSDCHSISQSSLAHSFLALRAWMKTAYPLLCHTYPILP